MLKVKLRHYTFDIDEVYTILTEHHIDILNSNCWQDTTTCLIEDRQTLQNILNVLNKHTCGVSILYAKPTLQTLLRSIFK